MTFTTADLCDEFESLVKIAEPLFRDYGQIKSFCGEIATVKVFEDNVFVAYHVYFRFAACRKKTIMLRVTNNMNDRLR